MQVCGKEIKVNGRIIRTAGLAGDGYEFLDDPRAAVEGLIGSGVHADLFTFMQRLPDTTPKHDYPMEWDNQAVLPVTTFDHWWTQQIKGEIRTAVRRSEKRGIEVREIPFDDALVSGIHAIYNEAPVRQGKAFWHYGKDLDFVRELNSRYLDRSIFLGAYLEGSLVGFVKLVHDEERVLAGLMQILSMAQHRDKAPTNALVAQAVRSCAERGIPYLVYGKMVWGKKHYDGLIEFKRRNGFQQIDVPRYYVPLTLAGRTALRLGLHRKLTDHIPEPVLARLLKLRSRWYDYRFRVARSAS
jgi:hypothetical protein